jgi:hypothetical protein
LPAAVAEAATAEGVVVSTEEVSAVAVSTGAAFMVVGSMGAASAVAVSTAVVVSMGDISAVALSTAVAFVVAVLVGGTGATTGTVTDSLMMSSSAASAFLDGGAGAIRTDITVMTITRMVTNDSAVNSTTTMDMADTGTTTAPVTDTSMAADQGITGVSGGGDKPGLRVFEIARLLMPVD